MPPVPRRFTLSSYLRRQAGRNPRRPLVGMRRSRLARPVRRLPSRAKKMFSMRSAVGMPGVQRIYGGRMSRQNPIGGTINQGVIRCVVGKKRPPPSLTNKLYPAHLVKKADTQRYATAGGSQICVAWSNTLNKDLMDCLSNQARLLSESGNAECVTNFNIAAGSSDVGDMNKQYIEEYQSKMTFSSSCNMSCTYELYVLQNTRDIPLWTNNTTGVFLYEKDPATWFSSCINNHETISSIGGHIDVSYVSMDVRPDKGPWAAAFKRYYRIIKKIPFVLEPGAVKTVDFMRHIYKEQHGDELKTYYSQKGVATHFMLFGKGQPVFSNFAGDATQTLSSAQIDVMNQYTYKIRLTRFNRGYVFQTSSLAGLSSDRQLKVDVTTDEIADVAYQGDSI